jgi:hypothetical protein
VTSKDIKSSDSKTKFSNALVQIVGVPQIRVQKRKMVKLKKTRREPKIINIESSTEGSDSDTSKEHPSARRKKRGSNKTTHPTKRKQAENSDNHINTYKSVSNRLGTQPGQEAGIGQEENSCLQKDTTKRQGKMDG